MLKSNSTFINKKGKEIQRQKVQCYTRVMGYLRPVSHYNLGKKSEFYSRTYFDATKASNYNFMEKYGNQENRGIFNNVGCMSQCVNG